MHRFFPASSILFSPVTNDSRQDNDRLHRIDACWDSFLKMSQDILFIFSFSVSGFLLGAKIRRVLLYDLLPVRKKGNTLC